MVGDGGGKAPQWARGVIGADNVARVLVAMAVPMLRIGVVLEPHEVNGQPGAIFRDRDDKVLTTWALDVLDGRIQAIRSVLNPDKLAPRRAGGGRLGGPPRGQRGPPVHR